MNILTLTFLYAFVFSSVLVSQTTRIDSLKEHLAGSRDDSGAAQTLADLADAYAYVNADSSILYAKRALVEAVKNNVTTAQILAHHTLGRSYQTKAHSELTSYHLLEALRISDSVDNKPLKIKSLELLAVSKEKVNYESAMRYLLQALQINEEIQNKRGTAAILHRIGTLYFIQGKYQDALTHFIKSKE
ncbi:MAG: tetratricopeptide repeat protein, partial [Ignavibacteriales bacterium]|nr:tetratricopeptide repeat protein [Ignavibacteriales bacterium]